MYLFFQWRKEASIPNWQPQAVSAYWWSLWWWCDCFGCQQISTVACSLHGRYRVQTLYNCSPSRSKKCDTNGKWRPWAFKVLLQRFLQVVGQHLQPPSDQMNHKEKVFGAGPSLQQISPSKSQQHQSALTNKLGIHTFLRGWRLPGGGLFAWGLLQLLWFTQTAHRLIFM